MEPAADPAVAFDDRDGAAAHALLVEGAAAPAERAFMSRRGAYRAALDSPGVSLVELVAAPPTRVAMRHLDWEVTAGALIC